MKSLGLDALAVIIASALLTACASSFIAPSLMPEVSVASAWSTPLPMEMNTVNDNVNTRAFWWKRFNDPVLDALISQALQSNRSIAVAKTALIQSRALRGVASASLFPRINSAASVQNGRTGNVSTGNVFNAGLDASWEPDFFGANRSAVDVSQYYVEATAASLGDVQISIAAEVALAYLQLRGAQARLTVAQNNLASQLDTLQITNWRIQAGLLTSLEGEQARAVSAQTKAQIPTLTVSIGQISHSLAVLCGLAPGALQGQLADQRPIPMLENEVTISIPAETLRQRPDVRAAEHQVAAAWSKVLQADAALYPHFQFNASLGARALTLSALTNSTALLASILANVSWPVFDGGASRAQVRAQQAVFEQARMTYQATVLSALKDVEDALTALQGDRERLAFLQSAMDAASNAAVMANHRYLSGLVDFQTVLDTQRTLYSTQDAVINIKTDLSVDHVRLYKALGGGWRPEIEVNPVIQQQP